MNFLNCNGTMEMQMYQQERLRSMLTIIKAYNGGNPSSSKHQYLQSIRDNIFRAGTGSMLPLVVYIWLVLMTRQMCLIYLDLIIITEPFESLQIFQSRSKG